MPELPEVETVKLGLARHIIGKEIKNIFWSGKPMRRAITTVPNNQIVPATKHTKDLEKILQRRWRGRKIIDVRRRAKYLIIDGSPMVDDAVANQPQPSAGDTKRLLLCHLGMSGFFVFGNQVITVVMMPKTKILYVAKHGQGKRILTQH